MRYHCFFVLEMICPKSPNFLVLCVFCTGCMSTSTTFVVVPVECALFSTKAATYVHYAILFLIHHVQRLVFSLVYLSQTKRIITFVSSTVILDSAVMCCETVESF